MTGSTIAVTLLAQQQCKLCDDAKAVLDRLGQEFPLTITTVDVASAQGQVLARRGAVLFPPGVFLDGEPFSYGRLSERQLRRELTRRLDAGRPDDGIAG